MRAYASFGIFKGESVSAFAFSKRGVALAFVFISLFLTAIGVVYIKDLNRRFFIQSQILQHQEQVYQVNWGKLLLEQSTLATQSRTQALAARKLGMKVPRQKEIKVITIGG